MKLSTLAAAIAIITVPIAVQGADRPVRDSPTEKRVCETNTPTGSRLGGVRRCRSAAERDEARRENRQVVDRIQGLGASICGEGTNRPC